VNEVYDHHRQTTVQEEIDRDRKKFELADRNRDQVLDREEFADFLNPGKAKNKRIFTINASRNFLYQ